MLSKVTTLSNKEHTLSKRSSLRQCFVCTKNNKKRCLVQKFEPAILKNIDYTIV